VTALAHTADCTGRRVEHFGMPGPPLEPWHRTTRCTGCGAQRVLTVQPDRDLFGSPLIDPAPVGVSTVHSFP
jgi:hypothetical protein